MTTRCIDLKGQVFGRLKVVEYVGTVARSAVWRCVCECGNEISTKAKTLRSGETKSCGCLHREISARLCRDRLTKHGKTAGGNSRVYRIWSNMVSRCTNPNFDAYPYYGGRGISVCDRWRLFENFLQDMGEPGPDESIDRIDPNGHYEPGNCRWVVRADQARNTRRNVFLELDGRRMTISQWANEPGAAPLKTIYARVAQGWDAKRAVFQPTRRAA